MHTFNNTISTIILITMLSITTPSLTLFLFSKTLLLHSNHVLPPLILNPSFSLSLPWPNPKFHPPINTLQNPKPLFFYVALGLLPMPWIHHPPKMFIS